ncbi:hypothetical protein [Rhizobium sp. GR12]|uniref:hypothetical protein n=1 Tax=Rhizobium sp. GR12 TaxID=3053925 RepID=UPI002FBEFD67
MIEAVPDRLSDQPHHLPQAATDPEWSSQLVAIGEACGIADEMTDELRKQLRPALEAIIRWLKLSLSGRSTRAGLTKKIIL